MGDDISTTLASVLKTDRNLACTAAYHTASPAPPAVALSP
jgi:hypothetical protein